MLFGRSGVLAFSLQTLRTNSSLTKCPRILRNSFCIKNRQLHWTKLRIEPKCRYSPQYTGIVQKSLSPLGKQQRAISLYSRSNSDDRTPMSDLYPTSFSDVIDQAYSRNTHSHPFSLPHILSRTIPPLTPNLHKGSSGRVSILGGSAKYTGAPYYAAMSALRVGADLAYVQCAVEASIPIKCYSPELMVEGVYDGAVFDESVAKGALNEDSDIGEEQDHGNREASQSRDRALIQSMVTCVTDLMDRMHVLVIGPGLGRCPMVMTAVADIVIEAKKRGLPLVLDADALYMLCLEENHNILCSDDTFEAATTNSHQPVIILTPNVVEYKRLVDSIGGGSEEELHKNLPRIVIVKKGCVDEIRYWSGARVESMLCSEEGGLKRSGGIGDILAGTIGTFTAWNRILSESHNNEGDDRIDNLVLACWMACCVTKRATKVAFEKRKRSMTAPDILEEIGRVVDGVAASTISY